MNRKSIVAISVFALSSAFCMARTNGFDQKTVKENDTLYVLDNGEKYVVDNTIIRVKPKNNDYKLNNLYKIIYTSKSGCHYIEVPIGMDIEKFYRSLKESNQYEIVDYVSECKALLEPNDPFKTQQWFINKINLKNAWNKTTGNPNVKVAIIDTGIIDTGYADLGYSSTSNYSNVSYTIHDYASNSQFSPIEQAHGTMVACVVGAKTNNGLDGCGISGGNNCPGVTLISYRARNALHVIQAINDAVNDGANVLNLSFIVNPNSDIDDAITYAHNHNVSVVCGSGNNGLSSLCYPASNNLTIAVGATKQSDYKCSFSSYGDGLDLVAPGAKIRVAANDTVSGTSFSAPMVSGTIALMLSVNPELTPDEIRTILHNTATKVGTYDYGTSGWNTYVGYGLLNTDFAVSLAQLKIIGPSYINDEESYVVGNLPSGYTVEWSLSDSYYNQNCLEQNEPYTNQCTITCSSSHIMMNETLTANVKHNGVTLRTLTKKVYAYDDFQGHYTSGSLSGDINYTHIFYVRASATTYITSPMLIGATASYSSSGATPSYWSFNPTNGSITMVINSTSIPVVINIDDVCGNHYVLYAFVSSQYSMNISNENNEITITLNENGEFQRDMAYDQPWTIEVHNAETGELKATLSSTSRSETISTIGWPKGIYIIKITIGKEELTKKTLVQ
jgi:subtilisin family serine protease